MDTQNLQVFHLYDPTRLIHKVYIFNIDSNKNYF